MKHLKERILKGFISIIEAKSEGLDTSSWEQHFIKLVDEIPSQKVCVKIGNFGFCTCSEESGLCCGCWKIRQSCDCIELEVDPKEEMIRQYNLHKRRNH